MPNTENLTDTFRTEGNPAPGELVRVHGFLNTWSDELEIEDFATAQETEKWLKAAKLLDSGCRFTRQDHAQIVALRTQIRAAVLQGPPYTALANVAEGVSFNMVQQEDKLGLAAANTSAIPQVTGRLLAIIYDAMQADTWARFKCCALPSCGWAYYDSTRSRTKRWCSMKTCGSRHKAREYYKRKR